MTAPHRSGVMLLIREEPVFNNLRSRWKLSSSKQSYRSQDVLMTVLLYKDHPCERSLASDGHRVEPQSHSRTNGTRDVYSYGNMSTSWPSWLLPVFERNVQTMCPVHLQLGVCSLFCRVDPTTGAGAALWANTRMINELQETENMSFSATDQTLRVDPVSHVGMQMESNVQVKRGRAKQEGEDAFQLPVPRNDFFESSVSFFIRIQQQHVRRCLLETGLKEELRIKGNPTVDVEKQPDSHHFALMQL